MVEITIEHILFAVLAEAPPDPRILRFRTGMTAEGRAAVQFVRQCNRNDEERRNRVARITDLKEEFRRKNRRSLVKA